MALGSRRESLHAFRFSRGPDLQLESNMDLLGDRFGFGSHCFPVQLLRQTDRQTGGCGYYISMFRRSFTSVSPVVAAGSDFDKSQIQKGQ
jgi:hypothetical protein